MIGSFWNLCRACPSMPVDKLHSEYRSTYRWHEYTGGHQEVVRRSPMPNAHQVHMQDNTTTNIGDHIGEKEQPIRTEQDGGPPEGSKFEPALPRRKKHPELAYRTHEIMACNSITPRPHHYSGHPHNYTAQIHSDRARSEDRANNHSRPSRRSKSEGPPNALRQHRYPTLHYDHYDNYEDTAAGISSEKAGAGSSSNLFKQAISKISTEYRLQFAWPTITSKGADASKSTTTPRKSLSMNAIRATNAHYGPTNVHKRTGDVERTKDVNNHELEPLVNDHNDQDRSGVDEINTDLNQKQPDDQKHFLQMKEFKTEYKKKFRPFSQYEYLESEGRFTRRASVKRDDGTHAVDNALEEVDADSPIPPPSQSGENAAPWYKEVIELRKKAGEYRHRGWGTELTGEHRSELFNKQIELWDQVSRRSSLSALSLAATTSHRSITKEEKEKENNNKSSPTKGLHSAPVRKFPGTAKPVSDLKKQDDNKTASEIGTRSRKDAVPRHHFDRTTGAEEGVILTSPTREKLEPVIPKKKDDDHSIGSQRSSSQKSSSQKSSPQKSSPQKSSPQKARTKSSPRQARSQSVGPASLYSENRSPKRQSRSATATSKVSKANTTPATPQTTSAEATSTGRRPRPTSLTTTAPSRSKCSSVPPTKGSGTDHHLRPLSQDRISKPRLKSEKSGPKSLNGLTANSNKTKGGSIIVKEPSEENKEKSTDTSSTTNVIQSPAKQPDYEIEPVVKSPPEPTRVKSPEQILMRSPDPVNWTVPLDTGKTFTVTQNVREGELINRPHSEVKAWTPPDAPPPAPQSAPPELAQQAKLLACKQTEPAGVVQGSGTGSGWSGSGSVPVPGQGPGVAGGDASAIINGSHSEDTTTASSTSPNPVAVEMPSSKTKVEVDDSDSSAFAIASKPVAGTSLRCLEDPAFEQYYQRQHVGSSGSETQSKESSAPYKVVEAPILESPTKPLLSPTSGRSLAADVLEKARNRFDRFWAKNKQDSKEGNV